jgi:outer membrane immunogenic protein
MGFLERLVYGFGTRGVTFIDNVSGTVGPLDIKQNIQIVKLGVNLHIFSGPGWPVGWW